jgi:phosphoesterase RecJ-like protein
MIGDFDALKELISNPISIVITTHQKPDGDAMGSSLGWLNYLKGLGHTVHVITPTDYPDNFKWMPGHEHVVIYPNQKELCDTLIADAKLICCLDFNTLSRIAPVDEAVNATSAPKLLIDHHLQPDNFDWMLSDTKACSTCELVYRLMHMLEDQPGVTIQTAQCLYTGLLTDTGNFSNGATNKAAFTMAADLMDKGLDIQFVLEQLNQNTTESKLRFLGNSLLNKMIVRQDLGVAIIVVDRKDARTYNLQAGDTEGLVNYPLNINGIRVSVLIKEEKDITKLSFRSKGDFSVNDLTRTHFEGGGHRNAAGGKSILPPSLLTKKIFEIFEKSQKKNK